MARILLQNGPHDINNYADIPNAVQGTIRFIEVKRLFGALFHENEDFYSASSGAVHDELSKLSERLAQGVEFSDYELMKLFYMQLSMRSDRFSADAYHYYKKTKGLEELFNKTVEFGAKNNPHKIMVEEAEKVLAQELPDLVEILAGKEGTVLHDVEKLWQAKANIWHLHRVSGLKTVVTEIPTEEQKDLLGDRKKLASAIIKEMSDKFSNYSFTIYNLITGIYIGFIPQNKKERLFYKAYLEARDKCLRETEGFSEAFATLRQELIDNEKIVEKQAKELHGRIISMLKKKSAISDEEAREWASKNVYISSKVANSLKNIGYPEEELRKDIAEYYQLCGGKLGSVEFIGTAHGQRASAKVNKCQINIDNNFNKKILFHECSHLVEGCANFELASSQQFIKDRATGNPSSLNKIVPNSGYRANEWAYPDAFICPYVGKIYPNASEVLSMGMQMFADPDTLLYFMRNDPEHFKLTISQCLDNNEILRSQLEERKIYTNRDNDAKIAWEKSLEDAMPKNFKEALLLPNGLDGCELYAQKRSQTGALYIKNSEGKIQFSIREKIAKLLVFAYLHIASKNSLLPQSGYGTGDNVRFLQIEKDIFFNKDKPPDWFDPDESLPKYSLPQKALNALKYQGEEVKFYNKFIEAINECMSDSVWDKLQYPKKGVEGYTYLPSFRNAQLSLHSHSLQKLEGNSYIGSFERAQCQPLVILLILNRRKMLPVTIEDERTAIHEYKKYVETRTVPAWYEENMKFPEIKP